MLFGTGKKTWPKVMKWHEDQVERRICELCHIIFQSRNSPRSVWENNATKSIRERLVELDFWGNWGSVCPWIPQQRFIMPYGNAQYYAWFVDQSVVYQHKKKQAWKSWRKSSHNYLSKKGSEITLSALVRNFETALPKKNLDSVWSIIFSSQ
jgi:hypothetical protein